MTAKGGSERFSLSRWSRRKLAAATEAPAAPASASLAVPAPASGAPVSTAALELPPVESLTFDSDFTAFLQPGVDDELKRAALKQLFRDPRFNIMDGLDTYIGDYTKADPIPPDIVADLLKRGFGSMSETGQEQVAAVNAPHEEPAVTSATRPAISDGSGHVAALTHPIHEVGEQGKHAKLSADDGKVARADDGAADAGGVQKQR
ncbi:MAG: DUF3306 domain-containing protein [Betaproteobacteria bacterium]|nr:MAG: DUF3306 domain-containing protein [Betaproteobacteria bacterium]